MMNCTNATTGKTEMTQDIGPTPNIPFVTALRVEMTGRAHSQLLPPLVERIDVKASPAIPELPNHEWEFHAFAQVGFKQTAPKGASEYVRKNGVRAICYHLYGPVEAELRLAMEDLWRIGVPQSAPAIQRIERLISVLRGENAGETK